MSKYWWAMFTEHWKSWYIFEKNDLFIIELLYSITAETSNLHAKAFVNFNLNFYWLNRFDYDAKGIHIV